MISSKLFPLSDDVIGMVCANDADCQNVLSNTVCKSLQCECAAGFSGFGNVSLMNKVNGYDGEIPHSNPAD